MPLADAHALRALSFQPCGLFFLYMVSKRWYTLQGTVIRDARPTYERNDIHMCSCVHVKFNLNFGTRACAMPWMHIFPGHLYWVTLRIRRARHLLFDCDRLVFLRLRICAHFHHVIQLTSLENTCDVMFLTHMVCVYTHTSLEVLHVPQHAQSYNCMYGICVPFISVCT